MVKFNYIGMEMPLDEVVGRLLQSRVKMFDGKRQIDYIRFLCHGNADKLRMALNTIDEAVKRWDEQFFISRYDKLEISMSQAEMDDLFWTERLYLESGKTALTADYLYDEIARYGFIDGEHNRAVDTAWYFGDLEFLRTQWEDAVLEQIRALRDVVCDQLTATSGTAQNSPQTPRRPLKRVEDYPEVFGMDVCCQLTGYSKDTIYKLTAKNEIPCYRAGKNGRKLSFKRGEIVEWVLNRRQETQGEFIERMEEGLAERLRGAKSQFL